MKRLSLTSWIFIGMAAGILLGAMAPGFAVKLAPVSTAFLRLVKSILAPLLFGTLVAGIASTGSVRTMGRIGMKAIVYFEIVTTAALFLGLAAVNLVRPGEGMRLERTAAEANLPKAESNFGAILEHTFPASIIDAMARGEVLQIVVFSFLFGAACVAVGSAAKPVVEFRGIRRGSDVSVHELRDVCCAIRCRRGDGCDCGIQGNRRPIRAR